MSLRVNHDERAISQATAFLDDPPGIRAVLDAIDQLADDPRPDGSFPLRLARPAPAADRPVPHPVRDQRGRHRNPEYRPRELTDGLRACLMALGLDGVQVGRP